MGDDHTVVRQGLRKILEERKDWEVVAEALTNVAKHAQATRAWLTVEYLGDRLVVEVLDNGRGGALGTGIGISGLRDRVRAVDGDLHLSSPPGGGTTLRVELPCEP